MSMRDRYENMALLIYGRHRCHSQKTCVTAVTSSARSDVAGRDGNPPNTKTEGGGDLVYLGFRLRVVLRGVVRREFNLACDFLEGPPRGRA